MPLCSPEIEASTSLPEEVSKTPAYRRFLALRRVARTVQHTVPPRISEAVHADIVNTMLKNSG